MVSEGLTESVTFEIGYSVTSQQIVILRESGGSGTPRLLGSVADVSGILDHRQSLSSGGAKAPTRSRVMAVVGVARILDRRGATGRARRNIRCRRFTRFASFQLRED
jgi:hypothetical protein